MSAPTHLSCAVAICLLLVCLFAHGADSKVKSTAIMFRHGQRTPIDNLPYLTSELTEDLGFGQLTNIGSRQLYENGVLLRLKYFNLFPEDGFFRLTNMQIMSSVPERTMMSLQSFMAGFFPPPLLDTTLPLYWQPFFFTVDYQGKMVHFDEQGCPRYIQAMYAYMVNPPAELVAWMEQDRAALDEIAELTGSPLPTLMEVILLGEVIKAKLYIEDTPQWAIDAYYDVLEKYVEQMFVLMHGTPEMIKIRGGPLITEIVKNMEAVANNDASGRPILIYSAHDMTVASLAYVLGVESQIPALVNYGDTIMVDLIEGTNGPLVEVVYMNAENFINTRTVLNVPGCGLSCTLATFKSALAGKFVDDIDALCAL